MSAATYSFKAVDATGTPEKGEITGVSREAVTAELRKLVESGMLSVAA